MVEYIAKGQVEVAPLEYTTAMFYLPHKAGKKVKNGRSKWRTVFEFSSHQNNAPSLNEVMEMGPNLKPEILAILLRFRLHQSAIDGDVMQTFLQQVLDRDRDLIIHEDEGRYRTTDEIITNRITRLPFGLTRSTFLLAAILREHAERHKAMFPATAP